MFTDKEKERYSKQMLLPEIGIAGQERLKVAKVLVVGAGGLGCPVLQYLAAAGVGTIGIADGDKVSMSNLQRQVLYTVADIGYHKASIAADKLRLLNPHIQVVAHLEMLTKDNALGLVGQYDMVVDGTDNFEGRYLINDACVMLGKPFVFGSIYRFEGQVSVLNYKEGPTYRCLFPVPPKDGEMGDCDTIGVVASLPGIIGSIQANETIKLITGAGDLLNDKLLVFDSLTMNINIFSFPLVVANRNITELTGYPSKSAIPEATITYKQLKQLTEQGISVQMIDVREKEEHEIQHIGGVNIPYSEFGERLKELREDDIMVLYCSSGTRSNYLAKMMRQKGYKHALNLENGIEGVTGQ